MEENLPAGNAKKAQTALHILTEYEALDHYSEKPQLQTRVMEWMYCRTTSQAQKVQEEAEVHLDSGQMNSIREKKKKMLVW